MAIVEQVNTTQRVFINGRIIPYTGDISTPNPNEYTSNKDKGGSGAIQITKSDTSGDNEWSIGGIFVGETLAYLCKLKDMQDNNLEENVELVIDNVGTGEIISADIIITEVGDKGFGSSDLRFKAMNIRRDYDDDNDFNL